MIIVNSNIEINENELKFDFIKASGPGGQNVNKVSSAVQLRFNINDSENLSGKEKELLLKNAHNRITKDGILIIEAKRYRTQDKNKQDAIERFVEIIKKALKVKKKRRKTKIPNSATEKRIERKKRKSNLKLLRKKINKTVE